jgi:hypothetical protein
VCNDDFAYWKKVAGTALFSDRGFVAGGYAPRAKNVVFAAWIAPQLDPEGLYC